jgi:prolyl 4-hydroxylase
MTQQNQIVELLEAKYQNSPYSADMIVGEAMKNASLSSAWLCHALASSAKADELAIVLALASSHKLVELETLLAHWPSGGRLSQYDHSDRHSRFNASIKAYPELCTKVIDESIVQLWGSLLEPQMRDDANTSKQPVRLLQSSIAQKLAGQVIDLAKNNLNPAAVYAQNAKDVRMKEIRDNQQYITPLPVNSILISLLQRAMCSDNYRDLAYAEPMVIYRYAEGQQYKWHYDFVTPSNPQAQQEIEFFGQRRRTRIINLNDNFEGGETAFKNWEIAVSAKVGQVIRFENMLGSEVDKTSVHAGKPITKGEKWICTLWMRDKPFWLRASLL